MAPQHSLSLLTLICVLCKYTPPTTHSTCALFHFFSVFVHCFSSYSISEPVFCYFVFIVFHPFKLVVQAMFICMRILRIQAWYFRAFIGTSIVLFSTPVFLFFVHCNVYTCFFHCVDLHMLVYRFLSSTSGVSKHTSELDVSRSVLKKIYIIAIVFTRCAFIGFTFDRSESLLNLYDPP